MRLAALLSVVLLVAVGPAAPVPATDVKKLIDKLVEVDEPDIGYSGTTSGFAFPPLGVSRWGNRTLGGTPHGASATMRRLVELGTAAVPDLLAHLDDARPTKIRLTHDGSFGAMMVTTDETEKLDPKKRQWLSETEYTLMVGDLCYVALGQIVNRNYTAARYQSTAHIYVTSVPNLKKLRADLKAEWGGLTAEKHRDGLVRELLETDDARIREGAALRLAYYYTAALEPAVLKQLAKPVCDWRGSLIFVQEKLGAAATAEERKKLAKEYFRANGPLAAEAVKWHLFYDLGNQEAEEEGRRFPKQKEPHVARQCLIEIFGLPETVRSKDRPAEPPLADSDQFGLVAVLKYDRSLKIDRVVRDLLAKTDAPYFAELCFDRLVGRGYDADIEATLKRLEPKVSEEERFEYLDRVKDKLGWTWLHAAVELGVPALVRAATGDKHAVNAKARNGDTPLHVAARHGNEVVVEMLLEAEADPNIKNVAGKIAAEVAVEEQNYSAVRQLVAAKSELPNVFVAALADNADRIAALVKADPTCLTKRAAGGWTALHLAALQGNVAAAKQLLALGAEVDAVDEDWRELDLGPESSGSTPLLLAANAGKLDTATLLLDAKADVNAATKSSDFTPLHFAASNGDAGMVKLLLARRADPIRQTFHNRTPLDLATEQKSEEVIKLLR